MRVLRGVNSRGFLIMTLRSIRLGVSKLLQRGRRLYRLCVGVMSFCGVRLTDLVGVETSASLRFFLGVFGTSSSSLGSHYSD